VTNVVKAFWRRGPGWRCAANVLDGPLFAFRRLVELLAADPINSLLATGVVVMTGTLMRAFEAWTMRS
jgi:hypothetical protein